MAKERNRRGPAFTILHPPFSILEFPVPIPSRGAAKENSPWRKQWEKTPHQRASPGGAKERRLFARPSCWYATPLSSLRGSGFAAPRPHVLRRGLLSFAAPRL